MIRVPDIDERVRFDDAWRRVSAGLDFLATLLHELPEPRQSALSRAVANLRRLQANLYEHVRTLPPTSAVSIKFIEDATVEQRTLALQISHYIQEARQELSGRHATAPQRQLARPSPGPGNPAFHDQFAAALTDLRHAAQPASGGMPFPANPQPQYQVFDAGPSQALVPAASPQAPSYALPPQYAPPAGNFAGGPAQCSVCQHPVQVVYVPSPQAYADTRHIERRRSHAVELDEEEHDEPRGRRSRANRRDTHAEETLFSRYMRGVNGLVFMLGAAVLLSGIAIAERVLSPGRDLEAQVALDQTGVSAQPRSAAAPRAAASPDLERKQFTDRIAAPVRPVPINQVDEATQDLGASTALLEQPAPAQVPPIVRRRAADPEIAALIDESDIVPPKPQPQRAPLRTVKAKAAAEPEMIEAAPSPAPQVAMRVPAPPVKPAAPAPSAPEQKDASEGSGLYVAVLSTHKDAEAARNQFAELQKKHAAILAAKQSEVQVTAGAAGTWHRLVVTPAAAKDTANELCSRLRASGYSRCWVKPY